MTALHDLTALEQAAAIASGELSSVEITTHYLERSERLDATVGAFVTRTPELALEQARAADRAAAAARAGGEPLPSLHGVVVPIKDLNSYAGVRTRFGSAAVDLVPEQDDNVVALIRAAGTVMTGKTNAPEFGSPCYTETLIAPPARTPWDLTRSAGGSSGGAAAAVAAGLAPVAHGSDGGGSIRIPASVCGLVGIKPTRGRVSNGPLGDAIGDLVVHGPLARTVRDAAALLDVMSAPMLGDPYRAPALPIDETFLGAADREPGRLLIGRYRIPVIAETDVDPACIDAYERATELLEELGHEVIEVDRPFGPEVVPQFEAVWNSLATLAPIPPEDEHLLTPMTRFLRARGAAVTGPQLTMAVSAMRVLARHAMVSTAHCDVVLTPTLARPPALVGGLRDDSDPAGDFEAQKRFTPFTSPYNITGQPAMSLPLFEAAIPDGDRNADTTGKAGAGVTVLPIGIHLVGRYGDEATLISLAAQLEAARPWHGRRPELW